MRDGKDFKDCLFVASGIIKIASAGMTLSKQDIVDSMTTPEYKSDIKFTNGIIS